ncbi:PREDICTED: uncharacterized protein LOC102022310 [Chinchilla lanigera]|uniref:uncharacterized protein LOC102022310 n=1 Tax=Chinchilla lanigera TaxID=34839 RepID=UPI00038EC92F|nr:PREDICTED: uncharacterized protein LOC102022310 [Chinchilla lanigera]
MTPRRLSSRRERHGSNQRLAARAPQECAAGMFSLPAPGNSPSARLPSRPNLTPSCLRGRARPEAGRARCTRGQEGAPGGPGRGSRASRTAARSGRCGAEASPPRGPARTEPPYRSLSAGRVRRPSARSGGC